MSRSEDLIAQLCPGGVSFHELRELLDYEQPGKYLVESTNYDDSFSTPVLTAGQTFILGHTNEVNGIYPASIDRPVVIFDDFTTAFKWVSFPFKAKSSAMKVLTPKKCTAIDFRFVYYAMSCIRFTPQEHARYWISQYSAFRIPVPPIDVQREIVSILNQFIALEVELEAELEARRCQYAFYRDQLVTSFMEGVRKRPMGEVGEFIRGRRFTKNDFVSDGIGAIHYGEIYTHYGVSAYEVRSHVRADLAPSLRFARTGDVIVVGVGETVEDVGKAVAWLGAEDVAIHDDCFAFRHTLNPKFVAYYLQSSSFQAQKARHVDRAKVKRISGQSLAQINIPVPGPSEQERIVRILDKFDALVNDPGAGLPAELDARRQQYEYYRDKLLTFEEAVA